MASWQMMSSSLLLALHNVYLDFASSSVLRDLSFSVSQGEFHAIVGEPKSGLTSIARLLCGIQQPGSGAIEFEGRAVSPLSMKRAERLRIALVTENDPYYDELSVLEYVVIINPVINKRMLINEHRSRRLAETFLAQNGFQHIDPLTPIKNLKLADRISLHVLQKVIAAPKLLIIDETIERLAGIDLVRIVEILKNQCQNGTSILYLTHSIDVIFRFAGQVSILYKGRIIYSDRIHDMSRINLIQLAYAHNILQKQLIADAEFYDILKFNDAILYQLPVNLLVVDRHKRVKILNAFARKHLAPGGSPPLTFINSPVEEMFPRATDKMQEIFAQLPLKRQQVFERIPVLVGGRQHHFIVLVSPVLDENALIGNVIILEDITTEIELQQKALLTEKLYTTGLLATGVAHEINNPLAAMSNYLEYLRAKLEREKDREIVDRIDAQLTNVSGIVRKLLSLSTSSQAPAEETELNLLSREVIDLMEFSARQRGAEIALATGEESIFVLINRVEYQQILSNLLRNSVEATGTGGRISIRIEKVVRPDGVLAAITVRDNGPGIQESIMDNLFVPFVTTRDSKTNTGLGLAITHTLVTKNGGSISARNCPDGGAEFTVVLPVV